MSVDVLHQPPEVGGFKLLEQKHSIMPDLEPSFSVRLFPEGFSVEKPLEKGKFAPSIHEAMGMLYPYNRASESFLRALDGGWIPGDLLEEIPCKYFNGCIACEVIDYCVDTYPDDPSFSSKSPVDMVPAVYKIMLKPTMESIAKDVSSMVDETWTYKDLMEVESKILKTAWPDLHLGPKSATNQTEKKSLLRSGPKIFEQLRSNRGALLNRRLRLMASSKTMVKAGSMVKSKKIAFQMAPERLVGEAIRESSTTSGDASLQFALKSKTMGPLGSGTQFPMSPKTSMMNTQAVSEIAEKQSSALGKRDGRELGSKLDIKKLKQDSSRLDKMQMHMDKGFGHKADHEQEAKAFSTGYENSLDAVKLENTDQHRFEDSTTRVRDDNGGFGAAGGQSHLHDPQLLYQRLTQPEIDNQAWQVSGIAAGDKDNKPDELIQRRRLLMQQKLEGRVFQQPLANDMSRMASGIVQNAASGNPALLSSSSKDQLQVSGAMVGGDQMLQGQQLSRRRTNSLPKNAPSGAGVASPGSTINSGGIANVNSPSTASMPPLTSVKSEGQVVQGQRREPLDNFAVLVSVAQRHGLPAKRQKVDIPPPDGKKTAPPFHELECALNTSSDEIKDPKGQRNMADSLVGGNVNARKTRYLQFQRQIIQGPIHGPGPHYRRVRVRLVMCERGRDAMVEAVVQFGDDQDDDTLNSVPHHVLPTMANAHAADIFAKQFCALLEKEGFELVEDQVQPTIARGTATTNAACAARPLPAGASTLSNNAGPIPSPRSLMNSHMPAMAGVGGMPGMSPLQPSSPGALASTRMPPPANVTNRQIPGGYLNQPGISNSSKPLPLDGPASQLAAVQHPQQHQSPLHMQRAQPMVMPTQLAQLNHNSAQQLNQQMVSSQGIHQFFQQQQQQQQRQQTQTSVLQRKMMGMGGLGGMSTLSIPNSGGNQGGLGNMMGVNAMNNVVGMPGMNNVSASMGGLNNVGQLQGMVAMGQNPALSNLMGRSGNISPAQLAAFSSKAHLAQGRSGLPMGAANPTGRDNLTGLNASNQLHVSAGMQMMGQGMSRVGRVGLTTIQRAAPVGGLSSPRVATSNMPTGAAQGMYLNSPQQVGSQQQFNLQQLGPMQQTGQQQAMAAQQMQLTQQQQVNTQVQQQQQQQQAANPAQPLNLQQSKNNQQVLAPQTAFLAQSQQPQPQQLSTQAQMNPASQQQNGVGSLGSLVGGPASPQLSSQNVGSVTSAATVEPSMTNCSATSLSSG